MIYCLQMYFALLDILRFLSAFAVLSSHLFAFYNGRLGVYLFFLISGFVIYFTLNKGLKEYAVSRLVRLYPLFWLCCTLTYLVTVFYGDNMSFVIYLKNMLMINDGKYAQLIDGSYWTLTFELLFYFYVGLFVWLFSAKRLEWFYGVWLLVSFIIFFIDLDNTIIAKLLCVRFAPYFVFGGMLALLVDKYKMLTKAMTLFYIGVLSLAALMPMYISKKLQENTGPITNSSGIFNVQEMMIIESFFILIILAVFFSYNKLLNKKAVVTLCMALGGITYPLYLLHSRIGETIIRHTGAVGVDKLMITIVYVVFIIVISYILSVYELPVRKYLKKSILLKFGVKNK